MTTSLLHHCNRNTAIHQWRRNCYVTTPPPPPPPLLCHLQHRRFPQSSHTMSSLVASISCFSSDVDSCTADQCDGVLCGGEFDNDLQFLSVDELCDFEDDWEEDFTVPQTVPDSNYCTILSPDMSRSSTSTPHSTSVSSPTPNSQQIIASPTSGPNSLTSSLLFKTSLQPSAGQVLAPLQHLNSSSVDPHTVNALVSRDGTIAKQPHRKRQVANTTERWAVDIIRNWALHYISLFCVLCTVEPLVLTDIPNSRHLPNNGQESMHQPHFPLQQYKTNLPRADTSLLRTTDNYACTNKQRSIQFCLN